MSPRAKLIATSLAVGVALYASVSTASDQSLEEEVMQSTVMIRTEGSDKKHYAGAGIILGVDGSGRPLIWTAAHTLVDENGGVRPILVLLRNSNVFVPAQVVKISSGERDLAVISIDPPEHWPALKCRRWADASRFSRQTDLVAIGADVVDPALSTTSDSSADEIKQARGKEYWLWSRLNRFNREDEDYVYMETPSDRPGFSGGPVLTRDSMEFVGLYISGENGVVTIEKLDKLGADWPTPGCSDYRPSIFESRDTLRLGVGFAQPTAAGVQPLSPFFHQAYHIAFVTLGSPSSFAVEFPFALELAEAYLDPGNRKREFWGQASVDLGLRVLGRLGFIEGLWAPGYVIENKNAEWTNRSYRVLLGRNFGDDVAGLAFSYVQITLSGGYFAPVVTMTGKTIRFPLVGAEGMIAYQVDQMSFGVTYRYEAVHLLYHEQPDTYSIGLVAAFIPM